MNKFVEICQEDIAWRTSEMALLKKSTAMQTISDEMRKVLLKYAVPALYALWEGFVTSTFSEYVRIINEENIPIKNIDRRIKAYHSFSVLNLDSPPQNITKKEQLVERMQRYFEEKIKLSLDIATNSNIDYTSLSAIMHRYGIEPLSEKKYKSRLSKFLNFRNKIAHGNNSISLTCDHLNEFSNLISELMEEILITLDDYIKNKKYLSSMQ